jgi:hypothetical protein
MRAYRKAATLNLNLYSHAFALGRSCAPAIQLVGVQRRRSNYFPSVRASNGRLPLVGSIRGARAFVSQLCGKGQQLKSVIGYWEAQPPL